MPAGLETSLAAVRGDLEQRTSKHAASSVCSSFMEMWLTFGWTPVFGLSLQHPSFPGHNGGAHCRQPIGFKIVVSWK